MIDHSENTLRAAVTCLRETVAPAVDPADPQASEQLQLTIDFLEFLGSRLYDVHARHRYELGHQIVVAEALLADAATVSDRGSGEIATAVAAARAAHADPATHTLELRRVSQVLWAAVRALIRAARDAPQAVRTRIDDTVVAGVEPLIAMESAWSAPFGFDPCPDRIPSIGALLADGAATVDGPRP